MLFTKKKTIEVVPTRNFTTGFTIIELLVVILIVGVLATVVLGSFSTSRIKARNAQRMSDLTQIQLALEQYYDDFGYYQLCGGDSSNYCQNASLTGQHINNVCEVLKL